MSEPLPPDDPWVKDPALIRRFTEQRPNYEDLSGEIAYILSKRLEERAIKCASISHRAKTLESFIEKFKRKEYQNPFTDIQDFAGARVVCFYPDDLPRVEKMIEEEFLIGEKVKKGKDRVDQFGYLADHYIVYLHQKTVGARYDALKLFPCEIQVRTVLQDAWAVFDHMLRYKQESDIPDPLKWRINALAGALVIADESFQAIRVERDRYIAASRQKIANNEFAAIETNHDTLIEYCKRQWPSRYMNSAIASKILSGLHLAKYYPTIADVDSLIQRTATGVVLIEQGIREKLDPQEARKDMSSPFTISGVFGVSTLLDGKYEGELSGLGPNMVAKVKEVRKQLQADAKK